MATIVCQGLQSCLESQVVESRTLRLKLSSPKPLLLSQQSLELALKPRVSSESNINMRNQNPNPDSNPDNGGWGFLQDLSNSDSNNKENVYIHPLMKSYSSKLSEKSLELCTESLGCETGSDISSENAFIFESSSSESSELEFESESEEEEVEKSNYTAKEEQKPQRFSGSKKANAARSFPPPLTTMSGAGSLQFRPRREDGRLVITAVKVPEIRSCFEAERSEGRLRLSFVNDSACNFDLDDENEEDVENDAVEAEEGEEGGEEDSEIEERDTEGNNLKVGGEIGKNEFQIERRRRRNGRCKEGELENKGLLNWEPFWVATTS